MKACLMPACSTQLVYLFGGKTSDVYLHLYFKSFLHLWWEINAKQHLPESIGFIKVLSSL